MAVNPVVKLNELYLDFAAGNLDRRTFMLRAGMLGISAASLSAFFRGIPASAQDATPAATGTPFQSITREQYKATLAEQFPFVAQTEVTPSGTVIYGETASANLTTLNPILANNSPTIPFIIGPIFETLLNNSPIDAQYVPGLADRWEIGADGKTYTYYLNPNAVWQDGTPLTADDVVFSFEAQTNPETGSSYTSSFAATVASFSKIDDHTVQVVAADVFAPVSFYGNSFCPIMPKHIWESIPFADWQTDTGSTGADASRVIGSGPFKFESISESEGIAVLVANDTYWDDKARVEKVIFQVWPDDSALTEALRSGEIDIYEAVTPSDVQSLQDEENVDVAIYDTYDFSVFFLNLDPEKTPLFQDVQVRQALMFALDRQSMVDNIMYGFAEVAQGTQPVLSIAYAPDQITTKYTYDPEKAKALLAEAGWVDGGDGFVAKDGNKLSFDVMFVAGNQPAQSTAAAMQDFWKAVGIDGQPSAVDYGTVLIPAITETFDFRVASLGFGWDPTADQSAMFATRSYGVGAGFNVMKYSNPKVDELYDKAAREIDEATRVGYLVEASNLVNDDMPAGIIWFRKQRTGYSVKLKNFVPNATAGLLWSLNYLSVEE